MKTLYKIAIAVLLLALFLAPTQSALAKGLAEDKVVFGGTYVLKSGETLRGALVVFGGAAVIETDAEVDGDWRWSAAPLRWMAPSPVTWRSSAASPREQHRGDGPGRRDGQSPPASW
jgi:hypothetical protein